VHGTFDAIVEAAKRAIVSLLPQDKRKYELKYWKGKFAAEGGTLKHSHDEQFYTTTSGLAFADYEGKRVLDIGCGPRGSLEWANMASERIGLDPLAHDYSALGIGRHQMWYVAAGSEHMPFADAHFDIVTTFNSIDHVDDLQATIAEIKRVARVGGLILLIVEINHLPTPTEPITLRRDVLETFVPEFQIEQSSTFAMLPGTKDVYGSVLAGSAPTSDQIPAILCAKLRRVPTPAA
jgi:SAM-dependent methyltransferase